MRTVVPPQFTTEDLQDLLAATLTAAQAHRTAAAAATLVGSGAAGPAAASASPAASAPAASNDADDLWNTPW